jgi:WD40 repeat protein
VILFNAASTAVEAKLPGHGNIVVGLAYTPDGKRLLSASLDKTARLWELSGRRELLRLSGHSGGVRDICVSHDGKLAATASDDGTVKLWELVDGQELLTLTGHDPGATSVQFLADDSALVTGGNNGRVAVWPLTRDCVPRFKLHVAAVTGICVTPNGLTALSAGADRSVRQFDLATGRVLRQARTLESVASMAMASDGKRALLGEARGVLEVLSLDDFSLKRVKLSDFLPAKRLSDPQAPVTGPSSTVSDYSQTIGAVAIAPDGKRVFAGGDDLMFSVFDWLPASGEGGAGVGYSRRVALPISAACFTADGARVLLGAAQNLYLVDVASGTITWKVPDTRVRRFECFAMSPDRTKAASASADHSMRLWTLDSGLNTKTMARHTGVVTAVAFSVDGKTVISASEDDTVRLWDAADGRELRVFDAHGSGHGNGIHALAVSPDGSVILAGGADGIIRKWDLSLPQRYRNQLDRFPPAIYASLDANPNDPKSLQVLGEWYAFRGRDDWAAKCLEQVRAAGGGTVSPLLMARCYWKLNRVADADREFRAALAAKEAPADYLNLCLAAVGQH